MNSKTWMLFATLTVLLTVCMRTDANTIRLHDQITVNGPTVELQEIAEIDGEYASQFAELTVGSFSNVTQLKISMKNVRELLTSEKANWGLLSLVGFQQSVVSLIEPLPEVIETQSTEPIISNSVARMTIDQPISLKSFVVKKIAERLKLDSNDLKIEFKSRDSEYLSQSVLGKTYEVSFKGRNTLGRVTLAIRRYELSRVIEEYYIYPSISRKIAGLKANHSFRTGDIIKPGSVQIIDKWIDKQEGEPIQSIDLAIGHAVKRPIREGSFIYPRDIKLPALIKRNQFVSVRAISGRLVVRTTAKALEDGGLNDIINVKHIKTNETYNILVTGRGQGTVIKSIPAVELSDHVMTTIEDTQS
ncbi:flagellar basal body P-ring biosynthesis protein FlgA [Poriferisphaera corsica]|uniref:Flagellar basal body P-ring biosynthesis protein FlgA n=1 Tax=Poriferisphaera corsica TaxID=2528020 RepID=A0A517YR33_9BACT|nr:flagellar basal body P-ring formation chaperone FlgA [Poriferisphaera corsica]QDU32687.1 flagellar basal body P-ring biosynthesis protein FlgA [Poriferisphaera corsica]